MSGEKEADPARSAPKNNVGDVQPETTPEEPIVKVSLRDMASKANRDAAPRGHQCAEEGAKEKFNAVLDELTKAFPEGLPVLVACQRASKKPVAPWKGLSHDKLG
jgi:hypothetical protein